MTRRPRLGLRVPRSEPDWHCSNQGHFLRQLWTVRNDEGWDGERNETKVLHASDGGNVANKKKAMGCRAKSPRAEECELRRGHRGSHSWSWIRKLNQPIKKSPHLEDDSESK